MPGGHGRRADLVGPRRRGRADRWAAECRAARRGTTRYAEAGAGRPYSGMPYGERVVTVPAVSERADASLYALKLGTGLRNLPRRGPGGSRHRRAAIKFYDLLAAAGCRIADRRDSPGFLRDHTRGRLPIAASGVSALSVDAAWSHCQNWRSETSGRCLVARSAIMTRSVATLKIRSTRSGSDQRWFSTKAIH
jgi:hypothetical protein